MEEPYVAYEEDYHHPRHYYDEHYEQRQAHYVRPVVEDYSDYEMDASEAVGVHEYPTHSEPKSRQAKIDESQREIEEIKRKLQKLHDDEEIKTKQAEKAEQDQLDQQK